MKQGELVICKITKINPHSVYVTINECDRQGMIHISEIASGWVKDIKKYLKEGQIVVCKVLNANENIIRLSIKRVDQNQKINKLREYKEEIKSEKMLEFVAKKLKQTEDLDEIKKRIKEKFGSIKLCFETSLKNEKALEEILEKSWIRLMKKTFEKTIKEKEFEFKAKLKLMSFEPNGIEIIKKVLSNNRGFDITYISAPEYLVRFRSADPKTGKKEFNERLSDLVEDAKKNSCFAGVEILKGE
ncbi:MAG: S1 RNA-binding domain-containing protein [Candidatus Aenigmatarchaeota archaeon]